MPQYHCSVFVDRQGNKSRRNPSATGHWPEKNKLQDSCLRTTAVLFFPPWVWSGIDTVWQLLHSALRDTMFPLSLPKKNDVLCIPTCKP